jgi:hypothetical protein
MRGRRVRPPCALTGGSPQKRGRREGDLRSKPGLRFSLED